MLINDTDDDIFMTVISIPILRQNLSDLNTDLNISDQYTEIRVVFVTCWCSDLDTTTCTPSSNNLGLFLLNSLLETPLL